MSIWWLSFSNLVFCRPLHISCPIILMTQANSDCWPLCMVPWSWLIQNRSAESQVVEPSEPERCGEDEALPSLEVPKSCVCATEDSDQALEIYLPNHNIGYGATAVLPRP
jgi:hypothetical protein